VPASDRSFQSKDNQRGSAGFSRPVVPDGNYKLEIIDSDERTFNSGNKGVIATFEIVDGPVGAEEHMGTQLTSVFVDSEASYWFQRSFAEALNGVEYPEGQQVSVPWSMANGKHVGAVLVAEVGRDWTNRQGESVKGQLESKVKRFVDHRPWENTQELIEVYTERGDLDALGV
jgi:hypothetical protein